MKKRIISMLLTVLMVMSLFSGLTVTADAANYNGANVIEYTMAQGDFVLRICQRLGLNYYTCKNAIMILNNITDGQWNRLTVGRTLLLPASDYDALLISNGAGTSVYNSGAASTTATTSNVTGTATVGTPTVLNTAATVAASSSDTLAYYLVPYTMSYGETVSGVCNSLGVNFSIFSPFIKQVNNITSWNKVRAGDTLIIPTPLAPSVGTTCYGVMEHVVTGSDTAYGIVNSKGLNYNANERLLKVLNQTDNLAAIKVGGKFFYPVPLTVSVPGTGNPGATATTTTTTTVTDGNGTTTTSTTTTSKLYKLTGGLSASDGLMLFYVDSKAVTAAPAGAKVTVVTQTNSGKAIQSLTVKHLDGSADLYLSGDTFVMPSCDVRVDGTVKAGHNVNITANYSGKATASVGGISVMSAVKGAPVIIKSTDPNYEISSIYATYKKLISASTKTVLTVSSSNAFIMPDADVDVEVVLKPVTTYAFYVNDPINGSFYLQVNGSAVSRAAKGTQVTVVAKGDAGYEPSNLVVTNRTTGAPINVFSNTFTMPASDVEVRVEFAPKGNNIVVMPAQNANVYAFTTLPSSVGPADLAKAVTEAPNGSTVYLVAVDEETNPSAPQDIDEGQYSITYDVVRNSDGLKVRVDPASSGLKNAYKFTMPKGGVTVTPVIVAINKVNVNGVLYLNGTAVSKYSDCSFTVSYKLSGKDKRVEFNADKPITADIPTFEYVDLRYDGAEGVAFVKYRILVDGVGPYDTADKEKASVAEQLTNEANIHGYFQIPNAKKVTIEAYFETGKVAMGPAVITGIGSVSYKVQDKSVTPPVWRSVNTCNPNDEVLLIVTPGSGYKFDGDKYDARLFVTRKDNGAPVQLTKAGTGFKLDPSDGEVYGYIFNMPAAGVDVRAIFDPKPYIITMKCVDEAGKDLTGYGLWQIAIDWVPGIADNATGPDTAHWSEFVTKFEVNYGDYVTVAMTEAGWSKYDMVSFRIDSYEYTADELNYFYNFQMIDERAKNLTITAVLRPKQVAIHNLAAMFDVTKGGVEFLIIDSKSGYSDEYRMSGGSLKYINRAVTGDTVAIVANSVSEMYDVKAKDITITAFGSDADRIIPTEQWIYANGLPAIPGAPGAVRVFTFTMPDSDVSVLVNFSGKQNALTISVYDADNKPINGMVRVAAVSTTGAAINRDVATDVSFDDVAFGSTVSILRSELALAQRKVIRDVEISTASGKSVPYTDLSSAGEGITFQMPTEPVWVIIRVDDYNYNMPLNVVERITGGQLVFRHSDDVNDPVVSLSDFDAGDTVYVFDVPAVGYAHLGLGDLKILANGATNIANIVNVPEGPDGEHVWSFTRPEGVLILQADFPLEELAYEEIKIKVVNANTNKELDNVDIYAVYNSYTGTYRNNDTLKAAEGQTIVFAPMEGYSFTLIESASHKGLDGATYTVPTDLQTPEVLTFAVVPKVNNNLVTITITTYKDVLISSATASGVITVPADATKATKTVMLAVGETITVSSHVTGLDKVTLTAGTGKVNGNTYTVPDAENDTLDIVISASSNPINKNIGSNGELQFFVGNMDTPLVSSSIDTDKTVIIKPVPKTGYSLKYLTVKKATNGTDAGLKDNGDGTWSFTMPEGGVNVTAGFEADNRQITLRILDKSMTKANVNTATGLTDQKVTITVNGTKVTYTDTQKIDTKTAEKLVFPTKTASNKITAIQTYKGTDYTTGTKVTNTSYTVVGEETYIAIFVDTTVKASSDDTAIKLADSSAYNSAEAQAEDAGTAEEAAAPEAEVEIPDYPKIESNTDAAVENAEPAEGEA